MAAAGLSAQMRELSHVWNDQHLTGMDLLAQFAQGVGGVGAVDGQFHGTPAVQLLAALQALRKLLDQMHATLRGMTAVKEEAWSIAAGENHTQARHEKITQMCPTTD